MKIIKKIYKKNLHEAAKSFLLVLFSDGKERKPGDFDEEILGGIDIHFAASVMNNMIAVPRWNKTIFFEALGDLVEEGKIKYWKNKKGIHHYKIRYLT